VYVQDEHIGNFYHRYQSGADTPDLVTAIQGLEKVEAAVVVKYFASLIRSLLDLVLFAAPHVVVIASSSRMP
jgi:hypothetical protein